MALDKFITEFPSACFSFEIRDGVGKRGGGGGGEGRGEGAEEHSTSGKGVKETLSFYGNNFL